MLELETSEGWKNETKDTDDTKKRERAMMSLIAFGSAHQIIDFQKERPKELAEALIRLTKDQSPMIRRGAARELGLTAQINPKSLKILDQLKVGPRGRVSGDPSGGAMGGSRFGFELSIRREIELTELEPDCLSGWTLTVISRPG